MLKPRKELIGLNLYETALYPQKWDMKLDSNENYIGPSTEVLKAIRNLYQENISQYPYYGKLYDLLAQKYKIPASNIVITNGADEALCSVINTYVTKEDSVLSVKPSFSMPKLYTQITGADYIEVQYKNKWVFPFDDFVNSVKENTKLILLTTPNNPTGDIIPLEQIIEILNKFPNIAVVIDETYSSYAGISNICLTEKYNNVIVVKSFSKDYALAGLRLGCVISDSINIKNIKKVLSPYNVNSIAVSAACAALNDNNYLKYVKKEIDVSKDYLFESINKLGFSAYKSYANFILADFGNICDLIYEKLKSNKIIVKSFDKTSELRSHLRITVPTLSAAHKIVDLISSKDTLVFDMDGVLVNVKQSYYQAIKYTYNYFTGKDLTDDEIVEAKKQGGLNNDWDLTFHLIKKYGFNFAYDDIVSVFQKQYWNDGNGSINNENLLIDITLLEKLKEKYNLAVFTGRPKDEACYTLKKFDILKYFDKIVTMDDVPPDRQKPHTDGLELIKNALLTEELIYFGDTVDDIKCALDYGAYGVGVLTDDKDNNMRQILLSAGAKKVIDSINNLQEILENSNETSNNITQD